MKRKNYLRPCFECTILGNEEIRTTDIFGTSIDNDLSWDDILRKPATAGIDGIISERKDG